MQYVLSQEEMAEVEALKHKMKELPPVDKLQKMCTKIANEWPTFKGWDGKSKAHPWGCIITSDEEWYCDKCPVITICPYKWKSFSK